MNDMEPELDERLPEPGPTEVVSEDDDVELVDDQLPDADLDEDDEPEADGLPDEGDETDLDDEADATAGGAE